MNMIHHPGKSLELFLVVNIFFSATAARWGAHRLWQDFGISLPCALVFWIARMLVVRIKPEICKYTQVASFFSAVDERIAQWCDVNLTNFAENLELWERKWPSLTTCSKHGWSTCDPRPICGWPVAPDPGFARCCWRPQGNWPRRSTRKRWSSLAPPALAAPAWLGCLGKDNWWV